MAHLLLKGLVTLLIAAVNHVNLTRRFRGVIRRL